MAIIKKFNKALENLNKDPNLVSSDESEDEVDPKEFESE